MGGQVRQRGIKPARLPVSLEKASRPMIVPGECSHLPGRGAGQDRLRS
ncbi:MAG: hypothetical protein GF307_05385 [candidate division Zixibacteria bacterium]|nr:hypothetical protein [candidate division Zixibacteria bacterium]